MRRMSNKTFFAFLLVSILAFYGCTELREIDSVRPSATPAKNDAPASVKTAETVEKIEKLTNPGRVVHILVALCDNENQGIVPVPAALGNGEDPHRNLYWGAAYGVKTFFSKSANWEKLAEIENPKENVLQRVVFKHKRENVFLVADAYRGSRMRATIDDFFAAVSGTKRENLKVENPKITDLTLQIGAGAQLVAFVGHNGLMDFTLEKVPSKKDDEKREAIILACASRQYFAAPLKETSAAVPLLWTTNLMAPEAYIIHDALEGWARGETNAQIRVRAASAYAKYQRINQKAAENLLVTGW